MKGFLVREILKPALRRVGTATGAALVAYGVDQEVAIQIATGAAALAGVLFDLVLSSRDRAK